MSTPLQTSTENSSKKLSSLRSSTPNWNNLPVTVWGHSISFLEPSHAVRITSLISRHLAACTENSSLWRNHLFKIGIEFVNTSTPTKTLTPLKTFRLTLTNLSNTFQNLKMFHGKRATELIAIIVTHITTPIDFLGDRKRDFRYVFLGDFLCDFQSYFLPLMNHAWLSLNNHLTMEFLLILSTYQLTTVFI